MHYLVENARDPTTVEARACLQAVTFGEEMGFSNVVVEGNALTVIKKLNSDEQKWKNELIVNTFLEEAAGSILRIPLTRGPHDDFMVWSGEPSREFSKVKNLEDVGKWKNPPGQGVKINFDGAYDARHFQSASGIVVRNREGVVLFSCLEIHQEVPSAFAAEAVTCRKAIQIGIEMKWSEIIVEGDSLSVIKKCKAKRQDKSQIEAYIYDIHQVASRSKYFRFEHTPRSVNVLAYMLAIETLKTKEETYLVE
ncbi:hypothetical protein PVK06_028130 [Gossypium arboreum]|uniref:RNase H type-1 domain-containing protein n=1 Tax=Gossypium arboreum TaxID=29729 RepID=A0ABR0P2L4_GOSAR|nr:hypothetical protein PVK06_028130 [Gossypium arboreum]